jgi:hypothetical protein
LFDFLSQAGEDVQELLRAPVPRTLRVTLLHIFAVSPGCESLFLKSVAKSVL